MYGLRITRPNRSRRAQRMQKGAVPGGIKAAKSTIKQVEEELMVYCNEKLIEANIDELLELYLNDNMDRLMDFD